MTKLIAYLGIWALASMMVEGIQAQVEGRPTVRANAAYGVTAPLGLRPEPASGLGHSASVDFRKGE